VAKFLVDSQTLQFVSNGLVDLRSCLSGIPQTTGALDAAELGGEPVRDALAQFDFRWRYGVGVITGEINSMEGRLGDAVRAYELIEQRVRRGAQGTGTTVVGGGPPRRAPGTGTGTTVVGGGGGSSPGAGTGTTVISGGGGHGSRPRHGRVKAGGGTQPQGQPVTDQVGSALLSSNQSVFVSELAALTGLSPRVVAAWVLTEQQHNPDAGVDERDGDENLLNVDAPQSQNAYDASWGDPTVAARQTAKFLEGEWGGASAPIQGIVAAAGTTPDDQMAAIAASRWSAPATTGRLAENYARLAGMTLGPEPLT
jgi:hypothetical protein